MAVPRVDSVPSDYYAAVYICISILLMMLVAVFFYVLCSRRYKLNWFEKTQLAAASDAEAGSFKDPVEGGDFTMSNDTQSDASKPLGCQGRLSRFLRSQSSGRLDSSSSSQGSGEFWVPPGLQRQSSFSQSDCPTEQSGEESLPGTPNTPLGIKISPFALSQMNVSERGSSPLVKHVQPPSIASGAINRSRVTSMYSKLDHTKFDATMYLKQQESSQESFPEDMTGTLQFTVSYNAHFSILCVHLIRARDLIARDYSGTADPYAKIRLLPDKSVFRESNVHKGTLNPLFEEEFVFDLALEDLSIRTLEILLYDFDKHSRHKCLGNVQVVLEELDLTEKVSLSKGISLCDEQDEKPDLGDLMFSLAYLSSAERLTVVILKARNLKAADEIKNVSDPYVKVAILQGLRRLKKKKTTIQRGTLNPVFNEAVTFNINKELLKTVTLEMTVMNDNILGQNEILGRVVIAPESKGDEAVHRQSMLGSKGASAMWHILIPPEGS